MIFVLDASTLINLANGQVLGVILSLPGSKFLMSNGVRGESKTIARAIDEAVASGLLALVDDSLIPAQLFAETKQRLNLDEGETECIIAADRMACGIACDDGAARLKAIKELGADRVIGSIGLLQMAQEAGTLAPHEALHAYREMVRHGGFLPALPDGYFGE